MKMNGKTVFVGFVNIVYVGDATIERMTQSQVLILQHVPWERPGRILDSLDDLGLQYQIINVAKQKIPDLPDFGEVSGVVESYLQDCWKWAAAKSEILPGAALTVEQIPAITLCEDCGQQYPTVPHGRTCPHCQSPHTHLLQGNEMMIKEVEAVEPETSEASG